MAYINAGIPLPVKPTNRKNFHLLQSTFLSCHNRKGVKAIADIEIRMQATSKGSNEINAFLINIKELPQTKLRNINIL